MTTNKQQKRDERQRQKDLRRKHRQEAEWKRQHPRREVRPLTTDQLRAQLEVMEAKERMRQNRLEPLAMAAALIAMAAPKDKP